MLETFTSDDEAQDDDNNSVEEGFEAADGAGSLDVDERIDTMNEKIIELRSSLIKAKQKLSDLDSDIEALQLKRDRELEIADRAEKAEIKAKYKEHEKALKEKQKTQQKQIKAEIKSLENAIPEAEYELKLLTNKGKLQIILGDGDLIGSLKNRWIDAEVAKKLDYPIFMAVSERGGKNNSGDYEHMTDENGNLMEFEDGQPIINQDLVNYNLGAEDLAEAKKIPDDQLCIAEAFVRFAQKNKFDFWEAE